MLRVSAAAYITKSGHKIYMELGERQTSAATKSEDVVQRCSKYPPKRMPKSYMETDSSNSDIFVRRRSRKEPPQIDSSETLTIIPTSSTKRISPTGVRLNYDFDQHRTTQTQNELLVDTGATGDGHASKCSSRLARKIVSQTVQESIIKMIKDLVTTDAKEGPSDNNSGELNNDNNLCSRVANSSTQTIELTSDELAEQLTNIAPQLQSIEICQRCRYLDLLLQTNGSEPSDSPNNIILCIRPTIAQLSSPLYLIKLLGIVTFGHVRRALRAASRHIEIVEAIIILFEVLLIGFLFSRCDFFAGMEYLHKQLQLIWKPVKRSWLRRMFS